MGQHLHGLQRCHAGYDSVQNSEAETAGVESQSMSLHQLEHLLAHFHALDAVYDQVDRLDIFKEMSVVTHHGRFRSLLLF